MRAVILAAGQGKRLRPLTDTLPKSLLAIRGKSILDYQLEALRRNQVRDITIVVGHLGHLIERCAGNCRILWNHRYANTNTIYSLYLASLPRGDVVVLHGDVLFVPSLLDMLTSRVGSCVLISKLDDTAKDFRAIIKDNRVTRIEVGLPLEDSCYLAPIYKFTKSDFSLLRGVMRDYVEHGKLTFYFEDVLNCALPFLKLSPVYYDDFCMEIDTPKDLARAIDEFTVD